MSLFTQIPLLPFFTINTISDMAPTTGARLLAEDKYRIAIIIQNIGSNTVYMNFGSDAQVGSGLLLTNGDPPLQLTFKDFGPLVSRAVFVTADVMDSQLWGFTTIYRPFSDRQ